MTITFVRGMAARFVLIATLTVVICAYFWVESRYPNLNEKAAMAESGTVADVLSVWPLLRYQPSDPLWYRVFCSSINWMHDNRRGMLFGLFLSAAFLTLGNYLRVRDPKGFVGKSSLGMALGIPLGLCVNCAAPVFQGLARFGRVETAFSLMFSSPTLNLVVLTMTFTLFPIYMGIVKTLVTIATIFVLIPVLIKIFKLDVKFASAENTAEASATGGRVFLTHSNPYRNAAGAIIDLAYYFGQICLRTIPFMVLAGILGALVAQLVPLEQLENVSPLVGIPLVTLVAIILPTPMAFDVMLANALYSHGLPAGYTLILLSLLGIYSVYSHLTVWKSINMKVANVVALWLVAVGFLIGIVGEKMHKRLYVVANQTAYEQLRRPSQSPIDIEVRELAAAKPVGEVQKPPPRPWLSLKEAGKEGSEISVEYANFYTNERRGRQLFRKADAAKLGFDDGFRFGIRDYPDPFWIGRGTAAGDFNRDGWVDIAFGSDHGVVLYMNRGGKFERVVASKQDLGGLRVYAVAFVDLNNDGWSDLFFTTFNKGNYVLWNSQGTFQKGAPEMVPNGKGILTVSPAFADIDGDGQLDVVNGNMALGVVTGMNAYDGPRVNTISFRRKNGWEEAVLPGFSGEAMSTLVTDLNEDGFPDIVIGNDFNVPDNFLLNKGDGTFKLATASDGILPYTPVFSMGYDSADLNNDGKLDLVAMGTTARASWTGKEVIEGVEPKDYAKDRSGPSECQTIADPSFQKACFTWRNADHFVQFYRNRNLSMRTCIQLTGTDRESCLLSLMWLVITNENRHFNCAVDFKGDEKLEEICRLVAKKGRRYGTSDFASAVPQKDGNYVFLAEGGGKFRDLNSLKGEGAFHHAGGWTWSSRALDVDNDGMIDVLNAEGAIRTHDYGFNSLMLNTRRGTFDPRQFSRNFNDSFPLFSFAAVDFDNDGDVDIIGNSAVGPAQIYVNEGGQSMQAVHVSLDDARGNRFGLGAFVSVKVKGSSAQFVREIKQSGGYQSIDPPIAYFGVGEAKELDEIRVRWRDGKESVLEGPLPTGRHYRIGRKASRAVSSQR